jgi:hypothetical protein
VVEGDNDVLDSADLPVSLVLRDVNGNSSLAYTTADAANRPGVDAHRPTISSVVFAPTSGVLKIGGVATATITMANSETGLSASSTMLINAQSVYSTFTELGGGQYRVVYIVGKGNNDILDANNLPVDLQLIDASGNSSNNYTLSDSANRPGVDAHQPLAPGDLVYSSNSNTSITFNFGATSSDANFDRYVIYYKVGTSGVTDSDSAWTVANDSDLDDVDFNHTLSTTITGLATSTDYVFRLYAYDLAGNASTSPNEYPIHTNKAPVNSFMNLQLRLDEIMVVPLPNGSWTRAGRVALGASSTPFDLDESVYLYYQFIPVGDTFLTDEKIPNGTCSTTADYSTCSSKVWRGHSDPTWWNKSWHARQEITFGTNHSLLPSGYTATVAMDTRQFISQVALSNGDDVRIVWQSSSSAPVELDRLATNAWNISTTSIVFKLQSEISGNSNSDDDGKYYIYYGNYLANNPPVYPANIYEVDDEFNGGTLAAQWTTIDKDTVAVGTDFSVSSGQLNITANGADVWTTPNDYYGGVYRAVTGDFIVTTKVDAQQNTNAWAKSGIMVKDDMSQTAANGGYYIVAVTPGNQFAPQWDSTNDGYLDAYGQFGGPVTLSACVRLTKIGTVFSSYYSANCSTFTFMSSTSLTTADATQSVGLFSSSHTAGVVGLNKFDYIQIKKYVSNSEEASLQPLENGLYSGVIVSSLPDSSTGYKWQSMACSDQGVCSPWVIFNPVTPNVKSDTTKPTGLGNISVNKVGGVYTVLNFGAAVTEANFAEYKIFYKDGLAANVTPLDYMWGSSSDANLASQTYGGKATTTIDVLSASSPYSFRIYAYDLAGNYSSSTIISTTTLSSTNPPAAVFNSAAQKTNGSGAVDISIEVDDPDNNNNVRARIDYVSGSTCNFASPLDPTIDSTDANTTADFGDPKVDNDEVYQVGSSSGYIYTSFGSNSVNFDWLSKLNIPSANGVYCLRLTTYDGAYTQASPATTTLTLDNIKPTIPGPLSVVRQVGTDLILNLGATTTETNFAYYKIFYKQGYGDVKENDFQHIDSDLNNIEFNNTVTTTISNLTQGYNYTINVWVYDLYGNKVSSSEIVVSMNKAPVEPARPGQKTTLTETDIANGQLVDVNDISIWAYGLDVDSTSTHFFFEVLPVAGTFRTSTSTPTGECVSGTAWGSCASNLWGAPTTTQITGQWYNPLWLYRKKFTIDKNLIKDDISGFPILIASTSDSDLIGKAREDGYDIVFTAADKLTPLAFEREKYSSSTGELAFWVKTDLSSSSDAVVYMYYGNLWQDYSLGTTTFWTTDYKGVWHMKEFGASAVRADASLYNNYATPVGFTGDEDPASYIDGAGEFTGTNYLNVADASTLDITGNLVLAAWFNPDTFAPMEDLTAAGYARYQIVGSRWNSAGATDCVADGVFNPAAIEPYGGATYGNSTWLNGSSWKVYDTSLTSVYTGTQYTLDYDKIWGSDVGNSESYTVSYLYSPRAKQVTFSVGSDDSRQIWINGHKVHEECAGQGLTIDDQSFNYTLKQGWNTFVMRVSEGGGGWQGQWRVSSSTQGLKYTSNPRILLDKQAYQLALKGSSLSVFYGTTSIDYQVATGTWQRLTVLGDSSNVNLYVNGVSRASTTFSSAATANNQPLRIGYTYDGKLDEVRVRDNVSSKDRVITFHNVQVPGVPLASDPEDEPMVRSEVEIVDLPDSSSGYKWQVMTCDTKDACTNWVKFNETTPNFRIDANAPTAPGALVIDGQTANSITLNFGSPATDAFFNEYRIYYKQGSSGVSEANSLWASTSDSDLSYINFMGTGSTTITGLANGTQYVFNIWAYDIFGRKASSVSEVYGYTNFAPTSTLLTATERSDASGRIDISASFFDSNQDSLRAKIEYGTYSGSVCNFTAPGDPILDEADYNATSSQGDAKIDNSENYQIGSSTGYVLTSGGVNTVNFDWLSTFNLPAADATYCLRLTADDLVDSQVKPATTTVIIDNVRPTNPGALSFVRRTGDSITVAFGSQTTETNFNQYKLFYKVGVSPITEFNSIEHIDTDLAYQNYNGTATTTISGLNPGTQYSFALYAYDDYGRKGSSTQVTYSTDHLPTASFNSASQRTDGSGRVDVSVEVYDFDGDPVVAKLEYAPYSAGVCNFASPLDPTIDVANSNTTADYGDPKVDNNDVYQIGSSTGYILTNSGSNTVNFDWLSGLDLPAGDNTYCLRLTANDGVSDQTPLATTTLTIDNVAPTAPGDLTIPLVNGDDVVLAFGSASTDTNFAEYKIFYKQGSSTLVAETDTEFNKLNDPDLDFLNYNGTATTVITSLLQLTDYSFNIWAYDNYGNKSWAVTQVATSTGAIPSATWREAEDTVDPTVSRYLGKNKTVRVRISLANLGDWTAEDKFRIQYAQKGAGCSSVPSWSDIPTTTAVDHFIMANSDYITNQEMSIQRFSNVESYGYAQGRIVEAPSNESASTTVGVGQYTELEYAFRGTANALAGVPYCFRVLRNGLLLDSYSRYPELTLSPAPTSTFVSAAQRGDGSAVVDVALKANMASGDPVRVKLEVGTSSAGVCNFSPAINPILDSSDANITATYGDPDIDNNSTYQIGSTTGQLVLTAFGENTVSFNWPTANNLQNVDTTYCLRSTAYDGYDNQIIPATTTVVIDQRRPTNPGNLSIDEKTSASVTLRFGNTSSDTHFSEYKIFYREGSSGVTESDTLWGSSSDPDLAYQNYNGVGSTTITGLPTNKQYVFKIFAYDQYGNKSSSSAEVSAFLWSKKVPAEWRFYQDQYNETPTINPGLNTTINDVTTGQILKLRMSFRETEGITAINSKLRLQYSTYPDFSSGVSFCWRNRFKLYLDLW